MVYRLVFEGTICDGVAVWWDACTRNNTDSFTRPFNIPIGPNFFHDGWFPTTVSILSHGCSIDVSHSLYVHNLKGLFVTGAEWCASQFNKTAM